MHQISSRQATSSQATYKWFHQIEMPFLSSKATTWGTFSYKVLEKICKEWNLVDSKLIKYGEVASYAEERSTN